MNISFHGACKQVTGSCFLVNTGKTKFLVDCGMFQGTMFAEKDNYEKFSFDPREIDFVILTHGHLDHCGRLPKLCKEGFKGPIYATAPTKDFTEIILLDSARIIFEEARLDGHQPLYSNADVIKTMKRFETFAYHKIVKPSKDVSFQFYEAGHILGSAFVEVVIKDGRQNKKIVFSGDLGNPPVPLLRSTEFINGADYLVMESTYGGRIHEPSNMRQQMLRDIFRETVNRGGTLLIPSFAIERTQQLLYEFNYLVENNQVPLVPVFLDSPMAIKATEVYKKYAYLYDKASKDLIASGDDLFYFSKLFFTKTVNQSKAINKIRSAKVIIAGSGMANGGRILHHLKRYLPEAKNQVLMVGYQAEGTLGRKLFDGARSVRIHDDRVNVKAKITAIGSYSAHADQPKLLHWAKLIKSPKPKQVFIVHGETKGSLMLADGLKQKLKLTSIIPDCHKPYNLL